MSMSRRLSRSVTRTAATVALLNNSSQSNQTTPTTSSNSTATTNDNNNSNSNLQQHSELNQCTSHCTGGSDEDSECEMTEELLNSAPPPPKHIPFPDIPQNSELLNEFLMFAYTALAASMQFLHLYRSVFWLPESNSKHAMNFYLIDTHLAIFIGILFARRFVFCTIIKLMELVCPRFCARLVLGLFRICYFVGVLIVLGILCITIAQKQGYNVIYLGYPLIVYFITFGFRFEPFLRTTFESNQATYLNGSPLHCCSTNPFTIRDEIESLKCDYNNRFKQVIFTTLINAYYAGFIPCCFAQSYLYYDIYWATQHMAFMILGGFTMCTMICFPANYCDVLHRASLHLGQWTRVEASKYAVPAMPWSKQIVWSAGTLVKYCGDMYKASGLATSAIPGDTVHSRFYMFFQNPAYLYCIMSAVQLSVVLLQLVILYFVIEWHNIVSLSFLLLGNYHTLFKIVRDYFVTQKIYAAESSIYDKLNIGETVN